MNTEQEYRAALKAHDWYYDYSDDYTAWCRGRDERDALRTARKQLDADGKIWNEYAPKQYTAITKTETSK
jgi:hypothetical protein